MRKVGLFPVTLLTLLLTVGLLYQAGWLSGKNSSPRHAEARRSLRAQDLLTSEAAYRHRAGHHHHWRSLVMHH